MKIKEALEIVLRSAEAHASGHHDCMKIHDAVAVVQDEMKKARAAGRRLEQADLFLP